MKPPIDLHRLLEYDGEPGVDAAVSVVHLHGRLETELTTPPEAGAEAQPARIPDVASMVQQLGAALVSPP